MSLEIKLGRVDKTYRPGVRMKKNAKEDRVTGVVTIISPSPIQHTGLTLRALGTLRPQIDSSRASSSSAAAIRPVDIADIKIEMISGPGKIPGGVQMPFEFILEPLPGRSLAETYHGVYVNVRYTVTATLGRSGFMTKPIETEIEFVAEVPSIIPNDPKPLEFEINPTSLSNVKKQSVSAIPKFLIRGKLNRTHCSLNNPFTGELTVIEAENKIKSIELQLVRVETIVTSAVATSSSGTNEKGREATEIQNLQIGDGDVCRNLPIPLYMIFPRVFTCPTVITETFRVEFEVNVIVAFEDAYSVTENFPITLYR